MRERERLSDREKESERTTPKTKTTIKTSTSTTTEQNKPHKQHSHKGKAQAFLPFFCRFTNFNILKSKLHTKNKS